MADLEIKSTSYPDTPAPTLSVNGPSSYFASKEVETRVPSYIQSRRDAARDLWRRLRPIVREPAAEFFGTMILVVFGLGVDCQSSLSTNPNVASSPKGNHTTLALGWGAGAALGVWSAIDISGGHINPAVTLVLALFRGFPWRKVPIYFFAQTLGAFFGALLVYATYFSAIDVYEAGARTVPGTASLFATYPLHYVSNTSAFFSEFFSTAIFIIGVLTVVEKRKRERLPRGLIPFAIFLIVMGENTCLGMQTSYAINPARDFGARLMTWIFYGKEVWNFRSQYWLWTPILGPFAGAVVGASFYDMFIHHERNDHLDDHLHLPTTNEKH